MGMFVAITIFAITIIVMIMAIKAMIANQMILAIAQASMISIMVLQLVLMATVAQSNDFCRA